MSSFAEREKELEKELEKAKNEFEVSFICGQREELRKCRSIHEAEMGKVLERFNDKTIEEIIQPFAGLDTRPEYNSYWGHDTEIGKREDCIKWVREIIKSTLTPEAKK